MKQQVLLLCNPCHHHYLSLPSLPFISLSIPTIKHTLTPITATLESTTSSISAEQQQLTARERRQLRNERRESKAGYSWREEVEERLIKKPKKKEQSSWKEKLNLDNLAHLGPQWWIIRVSRVKGHETADLVARLLARNYPDFEFKVYAPAIHVKRKLKNGTYSIKPKPIFPGCVFLWCILNKEIHDFIREIEGVGGFISSKVGNAKRQINKPRPVAADDMELIFQEAKEEQRKFDHAYEEEQQAEVANDVAKSVKDSKPKRGSKMDNNKLLAAGCTVHIVSGTFAEFVGNLKKLSRKNGKATVEFSLFGKETLVEFDINEIVAETT